MNLSQILKNTISGGYAVGSFSPRYLNMIPPVLEAAKEKKSPVIIQISQKELLLYGCTPKEFADEYFAALKKVNPEVPTTLHLDHTKDFRIIKEAIDAGFESVMIDASEKSYEDNVKITKQVVEYAHKFNVSVEAELGKIGTTDMIETDTNEELFTVPEEAKEFVLETNVDALAVSVGTSHGVYTVRQPRIELSILKNIKMLTPVYLVLHGGSGVPADMILNSITLSDGGISKVNIATDLEQSFLKAIGHETRENNLWCSKLPLQQLEAGQSAVRSTVMDKIEHYLLSADKAW